MQIHLKEISQGCFDAKNVMQCLNYRPESWAESILVCLQGGVLKHTAKNGFSQSMDKLWNSLLQTEMVKEETDMFMSLKKLQNNTKLRGHLWLRKSLSNKLFTE